MEDNVLRLDIPVNDIMLVQILDSMANLPYDVLGFILTKLPLVPQDRIDIPRVT